MLEPQLEDIISRKELTILITVKYRLANFLMVIGTPVLFFFGYFDFRNGNIQGFFLNTFIGLVAATSFFVLNKSRTLRKLLYGSRFVLSLLVIHFLLHVLAEPLESYKIFWVFIFPPFALFLLGKSEGLIWAVTFYLLVCLLTLLPGELHISGSYSPTFKVRFLLSLAVLTAVSFIVENIRNETQETMLKNYMQRIDSENRYRAAYEKLKETQSQLIQSGKLASIGELASGVAHELNQPLTVIRGNVQLMQKMRHNDRPHSTAEVTSLDLIERNTERMMTIINHLRSFTRQSPSEKISLKINDVIEDAFLMITEQLRIHEIEIKKNLCGHFPNMRGNPIQMEQVILNLITNARDTIQEKRTHRANGQPAPAGAKDIIEISTRLADKDGQKAEILIKDTGAGIPAEYAGKIFDPFFTTKEIGKGTGLGLSISYGIIRDHGGEIEVLETGPEGTTIRVVFSAE